MKRPLIVLMVLGLAAAACSDGEPLAPGATGGTEGAGDAESVPVEPPGDTSVVENRGTFATSTTTVPAEEMIPDELNVGYLVGWPTANLLAQTNQAYDEALDLTVNWIPLESGTGMARALEAGVVDIAYSQSVTSFATAVTYGSELLVIGVAVGVPADEAIAGEMVLTGAGQQPVGDRVFGLISTTGYFAAEYPGIVTGFLQVTEDVNRAFTRDPVPHIDTIANAAGMERDQAVAVLSAVAFPEKGVQLSESWLGGTVQQVMKQQMDLLVTQGTIEAALGSYDVFVDTGFLEAVR